MRQTPKLGHALAEALVAKNWKQADLAKALGIYQQTVSKWVRGETRPRPGDLGRIEEVLDLRPGSLFLVSGYVESPLPDGPGSDDISVYRQLFALREQMLALSQDLLRVQGLVEQMGSSPNAPEAPAAHS